MSKLSAFSSSKKIKEYISDSANSHISSFKHSVINNSENLIFLANECIKSIKNGGGIFFCGNGGSAADAQHFAAELVGRFEFDRAPLKSFALSTDTSVLTCIANDYSYDDIFARQVQGLMCSKDVLIGISTSGNSENVFRAIEIANQKDIYTAAFLGRNGGKIKSRANLNIIVSSENTARIQECHEFFGHILCAIIEKVIFEEKC
jgi:D-sedoheptulose 7-phosphate isomerase